MPEFLSLIIVHFLAVIAPGPEVILVTKDSLSKGRRYAFWLSIGIGSGTLLHVTYSLLGIGLIISQSILLFSIIKTLGALYLIYLGFLSLKAKPVQLDNLTGTTTNTTNFSIPQVLLKGFMTSALNPKATLFFFSIFTVLISPETPLPIKIGYGFWMATINALVLIGLSSLLTLEQVRQPIQKVGVWLERAMGILLTVLGLRLLLSTNS